MHGKVKEGTIPIFTTKCFDSKFDLDYQGNHKVLIHNIT